ncbi:diaminopimelate decarboxylase [Magnetovibrio sp. PR-2]
MNLWWEREGLRYNEDQELTFAGQSVQSLGEKLGTPLFLYDGARVLENIERVQSALDATGKSNRIFYAVKANRFAPLLTLLKTQTSCGVDVCSPEEVRHALSCGFDVSDISYTGTSVSNADLDFLASFPDLLINCDGLSMLRRLGKRSPGRSIGVRINPAMGTGYGSNELLRYSGEKPTKFGIYRSELNEALAIAKDYDMTIEAIHFHTGCGYLDCQLSPWEDILGECLKMIEQVGDVKCVNLGGGLGVPYTKDDAPLSLAEWSDKIKRVFGDKPFEIRVEPGTYIVKDAGLMVLEANTVETKSGQAFVGVNGGFNLSMEPVHYKLPAEPTPCKLSDTKEKSFDPSNMKAVSFAGNINEALDILLEDFPFPQVNEEDLIAFINAGAYTTSMSSNHCMRGAFSECLLLNDDQ